MLLGRRYLRERWDNVNGLRVFSRVSKSQFGLETTPLVLVHGLGVSSRYMTPLANEFAKRYRVFVPDLPGYGRSQKPKHVLDMRELAQALRDWLRLVDLGPALFVGNSMGCQILVELADVDSSAMVGAAFLGPTMDQYATTAMSHVLHLAMDQFHEPPSLFFIQAFDYLGNGPLRTVMTFSKALKHDMLGRVTRVKVPCLILRGEHDEIVSQRWVEALARNMAQVGVGDVAGAGHALNYNSARVIAPEMIEFWRSWGIRV